LLETQPVPLLCHTPAAAAWLERVESRIASIARADGSATSAILDYVQKTGGKRLRPLLVLLSAQVFGGEPLDREGRPNTGGQALRDVAVAVELVHVASLLHDDLVDGAAERRGLPTVVRRWGPAPAVLAGDFLFSAAFQHLVAGGFYDGVRLLSSALKAMSEAEIEQLSGLYNVSTTEQEYCRWVRGKTGSLFGAACAAGAVAAGAGPEQTDVAQVFGEHLGMAYQISDDLLDVIGRPETLGKSTGQDLSRGLITLPVIYLLAHDRSSRELRRAISRRACGAECAAWLRERTISGGAADYTRDAIRLEVDRAWSGLERMHPAAHLRARALLEPVTRFILAWAAGDTWAAGGGHVPPLSQTGAPQTQAQSEKTPCIPPGDIQQGPC
jgi:octaprenyl-diphosphate synthase